MWAAKDKSGELWFFRTKPERDPGGYYWHANGGDAANWSTISKVFHPFPGLAWEDEPIEVEIVRKEVKA